MVGKPWTPCVSQRSLPSAVQSTSATRDVVESLYSSISLSHAGFIDLQWPHQGAKNFTNTLLPAVSLSHVDGVNSIAPTQASNDVSATNFDIILKRNTSYRAGMWE
eukprot:TRINITY_DN2215_c0_g2_i1.p1 TRINITY_DN2215_c0_g2~~TRINITY_DN2215_c0_g2_i1.p1  ORF type:complete len:106 (+),score=4.67 TRINITY_DN2215_c0_g2_i1:163-480(+)